MKYYSEKSCKVYDSVEELEEAEKLFEETEKKKNERALQVSKDKKELSKAIDTAVEELDKAYQEYELAKKQAQDIIDASNKQALEILTPARESLRKAQQAKLEAITNFNKKYGVYTRVYKDSEALKEFNRFANSFSFLDSLFDRFLF